MDISQIITGTIIMDFCIFVKGNLQCFTMFFVFFMSEVDLPLLLVQVVRLVQEEVVVAQEGY